jgi:hypothetical protein
MNHKEIKGNIFLKCKKEPKKMWNIVLGCFKCTLQSFKIKVNNGTCPRSKVFSYVILHNLIIEDESNCNLEPLFDVGSNVSHLKRGLSFEEYCQGTTQIENVVIHYNLKNDLVEHLWAEKGNNAN